MKAFLCIPPNYCFDYDTPPLAVPMLSGFLKEHGVEVIQADLNMEYLYYFAGRCLPEGHAGDLSTSDAHAILVSMINRMYDIKRSKNHAAPAALAQEDGRGPCHGLLDEGPAACAQEDCAHAVRRRRCGIVRN